MAGLRMRVGVGMGREKKGTWASKGCLKGHD